LLRATFVVAVVAAEARSSEQSRPIDSNASCTSGQALVQRQQRLDRAQVLQAGAAGLAQPSDTSYTFLGGGYPQNARQNRLCGSCCGGGGSGGPTCEGATNDGRLYISEAAVRLRCSADPACAGYGYHSSGYYRLVRSISSVKEDSQWQTYLKASPAGGTTAAATTLATSAPTATSSSSSLAVGTTAAASTTLATTAPTTTAAPAGSTSTTVSAGNGGPYIPGTPGAPWTEAEVLAVKAKLWRIFSLNQARGAYEELSLPTESQQVMDHLNDYLFRPAPKMLRLGFHGCMRYKDGSGGCNGCLNWHHIGLRYPSQDPYSYSLPADSSGTSKHNGLKPAVQLLEGIYTNAAFPERTPALTDSLFNLGKSRADLWALAAIVAVEYGIYVNNGVCADPGFEADWGMGTVDINGPNRHCHHFQGTDTCKVNLQRSIAFTTGRSDCIPAAAGSGLPAYATSREEDVPDAQDNGEGTLGFFRRGFGFSGREVVAILGAHTMGRFHYELSLFRYTWIKNGGMMFNNQYYRTMALKRDFRFASTREACNKVGDAWGQPPAARWVAHTRGDTTVGGQVHWINERLICPEQCHPTMRNDDPDSCCQPGQLPQGAMCMPDAGRLRGTDAAVADDDVNRGCEAFRFSNGFDEMMIPAEIGLYYNFSVDAGKIPYGCPGFASFSLENFKKGYHLTWSRIDGQKADPQCAKNAFKDSGDLPLHEIIEQFADDQDKFLADFVPAMEKMLSNGYTAGALLQGPDQFAEVTCSNIQFWACWTPRDFVAGTHYHITSKLDGRVVQLKEKTRGLLEMWQKRASDPVQLWHLTAQGYLVNQAAPNVLLAVNGFGAWQLVDGWLRAKAHADKVLDRGWTATDGQGLTTWTAHGGAIQQWTLDVA